MSEAAHLSLCTHEANSAADTATEQFFDRPSPLATVICWRNLAVMADGEWFQVLQRMKLTIENALYLK